MIYQVTEVSLKGMGYAISNIFSGNEQKAADVVGGPVATVAAIKSTSHQGWREVLLLIALISISLGLMNILPIPALDGGRWFVLALFTYWRRPLKKELEEKIHGTGMLALIVLIIVISVVDIKRII
jgi:regulator of sigma E protease